MNVIEAMARAFLKSYYVVDVPLKDYEIAEAIGCMRAAVRALLECGPTHNMVNASRLGMIECCEEFRAMLAAMLEET